MSDRCWLVDDSGKLVDIDVDSKLDFHFDNMLDKVADWKKQSKQDSSLLGNCNSAFFISLLYCVRVAGVV